MTNVEHLFICLFAMSSLGKCLLSSLARFLMGRSFFWSWAAVASLAIIFSRSEGCLFTLLRVSFIVQKLFILIRSHLFIFSFISKFWEVGHRGSCCDLCQRVLPIFSSRSFIVSGLTFRSLIHFEFIFVCGVRKCSSFILLQVVYCAHLIIEPPNKIYSTHS